MSLRPFDQKKERFPILSFLAVVIAGLCVGYYVFNYVPLDSLRNGAANQNKNEKTDDKETDLLSKNFKLIDNSELSEDEPIAFQVAEEMHSKTRSLSTSWQNPFEERLWNYKKWSIDTQGLLYPAPKTEKPQECLFARPYRTLMCDINLRVHKNIDVPFETPWVGLRLSTPISEAYMDVLIDVQSILVLQYFQEGDEMKEKVLLKRKLPKDFELDAASKSYPIRFTSTGNRISLTFGNQRVFSIDQPASQSGQWNYFSLLGFQSKLEIEGLRFEGE